MKNPSCIVLTCCALIAGVSSSGQVILRGVQVFSTDSTGILAGHASGEQHVWNTATVDCAANLFYSSGGFFGGFLNGPSDSQIALAFSLPVGKHTFYIHANSVPSKIYSHYGLSLFFGSNTTTPGIAALTETDAVGGPALGFSVVPSATPILDHNGCSFSTAPGTLSTVNNGLVVTLVEFSWFDPAVLSSDRVGYWDASSDGTHDFLGKFTLEVAVPEPAHVATAFAGLALGFAVWRRNSRDYQAPRCPPSRS